MRFIPILILLLALVGCETTDHEGFKRMEGSVHYRLVALGDMDKKVSDDRFLSMTINAHSLGGKVLARKKLNRVSVERTIFPRAVENLLDRSAEGDSLIIRGMIGELQANEWFRPIPLGDDTTVIEIRMVVSEVLTAEEVLQYRAEERSAKDHELEQLALLQSALDSLGFDADEQSDGIYFRMKDIGKGVRPASGNELTVRYKTFLCDGSLVDDTFKGDPLQYIVGKPDQVLPGFGKAIMRMQEGSKALFVIPSDQAYGASGSSSGIVPPHAALIYEAYLERVRS